MSKPIKLTDVDVKKSLKLVKKVISSGNLAMGPVVQEFEARVSEMLGVKHAIAVNNGTSALSIAAESLGIGPGDEVITSPFTFIATVNAVARLGATIVFVDIDDYFNLDTTYIESAITDKTKAIIPVSLFGQTANMSAVMDVANRYNLRVIEDASQSFMAKHRNIFSGTFDIGTFSFYATKNLCTGEGGMVTTNDDVIAEKIKLIRNQGMRERYEYILSGSNYRMTDLQAAIGLPQLDMMSKVIRKRQLNAEFLSLLLEGTPGVILPRAHEENNHVWHQYTIIIESIQSNARDFVQHELASANIASGKYYPKALTEYEFIREVTKDKGRHSSIHRARYVSERCLSLPIHQKLNKRDLIRIADSTKEAMRKMSLNDV